ncbi:MAG: hypothetical protein H0V73_11865 [Chloroflexi bacterium]|nr:hypothetical protein [Chloroflexota bacterium]
MTDRTDRRPLRIRLLGAATAAAAVGVVAMAVLVARPAVGPASTPGPSGGPISASCVEPYREPGSITRRTFAFDGTVTAISGDQVTFAINRAYRGLTGSSTTLDAPGMTGTSITSAGGPNLAMGDRYLVAGDDHFVWGCGYTQAYDDGVAAQWATATGS